MAAITQRTFTRSFYQAPVQFSPNGNGSFQAGTMVNISAGGLCFESDNPVPPGAGLKIRFENCVQDPYWPEACDTYYAEVRWCSEHQAAENGGAYGVGVRFLMEKCRQCGKSIPHRHEHHVGLCPECYSEISSVSDPVLRSSIESYLMGNVL